MESRRSSRASVRLDVTLMRRHGGPVLGRTEDLGPGGARVVVDRPLSIDEELLFDLVSDEGHVDGRCRVLRQQALNCYALRFEHLDPRASATLSGVLARAA